MRRYLTPFFKLKRLSSRSGIHTEAMSSNDFRSPTMPYISTDKCIALCHGFLGTDHFAPGIDYFRGIKEDLEGRGCKVIVPTVSMTGSIEERANQLNSKVGELLTRSALTADKPDVHLICHSMGGLDARRLVHFPGLGYNVLSITTVSTPHHGTPIGSESFSNSVGPLAKVLLDSLQRSGKAMHDMLPEHMADFNAQYKDVPGIKYYSVVSKFKPWFNHIFYASHKFIMEEGNNSQYPEAFGENDGLVSVNSAKWGEFLGVLSKETSHFGVVGWGILGIAAGDSNYNAKDLYRWLVDNVARKVEGKTA